MNTFIADIIPKLQRYSQTLDNLTLLINQHWVVIDEPKNAKNVYIFRSNKELLISQNGKVEKAKWEYLGNDSLLIDRKDESFLFKHGFFDEKILALKIDSQDQYAFLVNESKVGYELNTIDQIVNYLSKTYLYAQDSLKLTSLKGPHVIITKKSDKGMLSFLVYDKDSPLNIGTPVFQNDYPAMFGKYRIGFMWHIHVVDGKIDGITPW